MNEEQANLVVEVTVAVGTGFIVGVNILPALSDLLAAIGG